MTETKTQDRVPTLVVSDLSKRFGGAQALDDVNITILPGEVHGLLGENGSGKSTLIKILAGYHAPDSGQLEVNGQGVKLPLRPGQFRDLSMSFVHQDLGLVTSLSVLENLLVSEIAGPGRRWFSWSRERRRASKTFERYGITIEPAMKVADLSPVERALLAIVRAVEEIRVEQEEREAGRGLLILDEPTVFLPKTDTDQLFALIRDIAATRASVLFVSHDLDEVREITDRVTVLRDGRNAGTVVTSDVAKAQLVALIIGRELEAFDVQHNVSAEAVDATGGPAGDAGEAMDIEVSDLTGGALQDVSFVLPPGEVLGVTGLAGSGFEDLAYLLFGARPSERGRLRIGPHEHDLASMSPPRALDAGMALVPADRQRDGSIGSLSVADNVTMQVLGEYFRNLKLERRRMITDTRSLGGEFDVRPNNPHLTYSSLSGGNQQRALLAKWLQTKPPLLLLHEPTQGVDVGARHQIFAMIRDVAGKGQSVICASSDYEQLGMICDRVLIFANGKIVQQLTGGNVTKERITEQAHARA